MYAEDQLLPISALQHLIFCERQAALIHVERLWAENVWTVQGQHLHRKAHQTHAATMAGVRIASSLPLRSLKLGLVGQADVVEFHPDGTIIPIEYKRGQPKKNDSDRVQICAQTFCLEEMLKTNIESGFLFYGKRKRRTEVLFDSILRQRTTAAIARLREIIDNRETPPATRLPKCDSCSLLQLCLPDAMRFKTGASQFNQRQLTAAVANELGPETDDWELA